MKDSTGSMTALDFFVLWMGAAISLAEIWAGGLLAPLGFLGGLTAILLGHVIGNTPMALGGIIGSRHRVPAMVSTRSALGMRGAWLPAALNCIQLVGWTAVMLWICGQSAARVAGAASPFGPRAWILGAGILTTVWTLIGQRIRNWLQRVSVALLTLLSMGMTFVVFQRYSLPDLLALRPTGALSFGQGLDLVIAMPISWLPLVSDYSRFARSTRGSFWGTWWGYLLAGSWMYAVGLCAALAVQTAEPDAMVMDVMAEIGLVAPALLIVVLSTVTTTFLDIYSNAVSARSIAPNLNERAVIVAGGLLGTVLALFFRPAQYESFLFLIGAMFCPLFGVVLADYFVLKGRAFDPASGCQTVRLSAFIAWAAGFALYEWASHRGWNIGASMPSLIGAAALYLVIPKRRRPPQPTTMKDPSAP